MRTKWTHQEDMQLHAHYATTDNLTLSQAMGRSELSVAQRASILGLRKDKSYISAVNSKSASGLSKTFRCKFCNLAFAIAERHSIEINGERVESEHCNTCALERRLNALVNNWPITSKGELIAWAMSEN